MASNHDSLNPMTINLGQNPEYPYVLFMCDWNNDNPLDSKYRFPGVVVDGAKTLQQARTACKKYLKPTNIDSPQKIRRLVLIYKRTNYHTKNKCGKLDLFDVGDKVVFKLVNSVEMYVNKEGVKKIICYNPASKKPTELSKRVSSSAVPSRNSNYLRVWYASAFPEDDLGKSIAPRATFDGLRKVLLGHHHGKDVYEYIGVGDSIIRERLFDELARRLGTSYDYVFNLWLKS